MGLYIGPRWLGIRVTKRGMRASVGPRLFRVHTGAGGTGISTGAGPVSFYQPIRGRSRRRVYHGTLPGGWKCPHNHSRPDLAQACADREASRRAPLIAAQQQLQAEAETERRQRQAQAEAERRLGRAALQERRQAASQARAERRQASQAARQERRQARAERRAERWDARQETRQADAQRRQEASQARAERRKERYQVPGWRPWYCRRWFTIPAGAIAALWVLLLCVMLADTSDRVVSDHVISAVFLGLTLGLIVLWTAKARKVRVMRHAGGAA